MDYRRDLAITEAARDQSSNRVIKRGLFAPASPASSSNISPGTRKPSLRPPETGALKKNLFYFLFLTLILTQFLYMMVESIN